MFSPYLLTLKNGRMRSHRVGQTHYIPVDVSGRGYTPWGREGGVSAQVRAGSRCTHSPQAADRASHAARAQPPRRAPQGAGGTQHTPGAAASRGRPEARRDPGILPLPPVPLPPSRGPSPPRPGSLKGLVNRQLRPRLMQHSEVCTSQWNGRHGSTAQARNLVSRSGTRTPWLSAALTTYRLSGAPSRSTRTRHRPSRHRERRRATIRGVDQMVSGSTALDRPPLLFGETLLQRRSKERLFAPVIPAQEIPELSRRSPMLRGRG